jgi:S-adenosyl-L-methionine hydrolase (adenosine-forming)
MQMLTLTTDFGSQNFMLASVKGKIYTALPNIVITDITHDIPKYNTQHAAFAFRQSYLNFPVNTVHFVLFNLYANKKKQLLYVYENGHHIFCADNGFLTMLFDTQPIQINKIVEPLYEYDYLNITNAFLATFIQIAQQNKSVVETISVQETVIKSPQYPAFINNTIDAQVLYIDHFGNVVLNVTKEFFYEVGQKRKFKILFMRDEEISVISKHYFDVPESEVVCIFNTSNHLEIAVNKGNAAELFGFKEHQEKSFFYNQIKIFFE